MYNIFEQRWDDALLEALDVPSPSSPPFRPSSGVFAETSALGGSIPVAGVGGDQQAALFGQAAFEPGMAKNTYGTGAFLLMNVGDRRVRSDSLLTTIAWGLSRDNRDEITYALEGSVFIAGAAIQWLRDELGIIASAAESEQLAGSVPDMQRRLRGPRVRRTWRAALGSPRPRRDLRADPRRQPSSSRAGYPGGDRLPDARRHRRRRGGFRRRAHRAAGRWRRGGERPPPPDPGGRPWAATSCGPLSWKRPLSAPPTWPVLRSASGRDTGEVARNWREDRRFTLDMPAERREELYAGWKRAVERAKGWTGRRRLSQA